MKKSIRSKLLLFAQLLAAVRYLRKKGTKPTRDKIILYLMRHLFRRRKRAPAKKAAVTTSKSSGHAAQSDPLVGLPQQDRAKFLNAVVTKNNTDKANEIAKKLEDGSIKLDRALKHEEDRVGLPLKIDPRTGTTVSFRGKQFPVSHELKQAMHEAGVDISTFVSKLDEKTKHAEEKTKHAEEKAMRLGSETEVVKKEKEAAVAKANKAEEDLYATALRNYEKQEINADMMKRILKENGIPMKQYITKTELYPLFRQTEWYKTWRTNRQAEILAELAKIRRGSGLRPAMQGMGVDGTTTAGQIDKLMRRLRVRGWQGLPVARDQGLPISKPGSRLCWIKNLDPLGKPGSHWIAVLITPSSAEYFDPFGDPCPVDILTQIAHRAPSLAKFKENTQQLQDVQTANCGWFCMKFLNDRSHGQSFAEATGFTKQNLSPERERDIERFRSIEQRGEGIIDNIRAALKGPRKGAPPDVAKYIAAHSDLEIKSITICRSPVQSGVKKALDFLSLGKFSDLSRKLGYDDVFHLYLYINGTIRIEKNEVVRITNTNVDKEDPKNCMTVPLHKSLTFGELFSRAQHVQGEKFWLYDARDNNCQMFILSMLRGSNLLTESLRKFIKQDMESVFKSLPHLGVIAKGVTDLAGTVDVLRQGGFYVERDTRLSPAVIRSGPHL